ncbi:MAG: DUF4332 domain-containing protein [Cyanobacteriota bacterium]|uniref:DUF4332 domain-containing protein n=1 Tax=Synechococcus sp. KORDI-100 TaxID=1280380 RepID=UPI0004E03457|nr:DUF4332 domain-containing protein [Synechococcus sp. KORDI-100]AII43883.1 hypothetical protein KR100_10990 [Synechococcus sp. KORDI-100]MEC8215144.1 DUF4332 domain-containing protein [Cyanobacteriota bacterium]MED5384134.1 DUF4332 domain-containing protein [Cyanobacteriota bacterium]
MNDLPQSFRHEQADLAAAGIDTWPDLRDLSDLELSRLVRTGRSSARNLHRLRGMAVLVCDLELAPQDAALLMHAGIASASALAKCTPERLVRQTGRLERSLGSGRRAVVDLRVAQNWIRRARQLTN